VDPCRHRTAAGASPEGRSLSGLASGLLPHFNLQNEILSGRLRFAVNYGFNRVRFPHPVRSALRVRNRAVLKAVERRGFHKVLVTLENTVEIEGAEKPAMVADLLALLYL
jgi:acyl dehydratase